jgi:acylphosphatase
VRNRPDGTVEALFEGDKGKVNEMIQWCHRGPSAADVKNVHVTWEKVAGDYDDFSVTY